MLDKGFIMAEFKYNSIAEKLWREKLQESYSLFNICFDIENNDSFTDPFEIKVKNCKFTCQAYVGCGDWESTILYYRCQYFGRIDDSKNYVTIKYFDDLLDTCNHSHFIFIPSKEDGNLNLESVQKGKFAYRPLDANSKDSVTSKELSEKQCRTVLNKFLEEMIVEDKDTKRAWVLNNCKFAQMFPEQSLLKTPSETGNPINTHTNEPQSEIITPQVTQQVTPQAMDEKTQRNKYLSAKLIMCLTEYDRKQEKKKFYNRYALAMYCGAAQEVDKLVESGMSWLNALKSEFIFERGRFGISALDKFVVENGLV